MTDLSGLPANTLLNLLRMCTDITAHRGYEPAYVRVVRESVEEARKPVTAPVEPVQVLCGPDGQWSITGLSEDDLGALWGAFDLESLEDPRAVRLQKIIGSVLPD